MKAFFWVFFLRTEDAKEYVSELHVTTNVSP